jgi:hypothetical protein
VAVAVAVVAVVVVAVVAVVVVVVVMTGKRCKGGGREPYLPHRMLVAVVVVGVQH